MKRESFKRNLALEKAVPLGLFEHRASSGTEEEENIFINSGRQESS
jgi:hypothetical protein